MRADGFEQAALTPTPLLTSPQDVVSKMLHVTSPCLTAVQVLKHP